MIQNHIRCKGIWLSKGEFSWYTFINTPRGKRHCCHACQNCSNETQALYTGLFRAPASNTHIPKSSNSKIQYTHAQLTGDHAHQTQTQLSSARTMKPLLPQQPSSIGSTFPKTAPITSPLTSPLTNLRSKSNRTRTNPPIFQIWQHRPRSSTRSSYPYE